MTQRTTATCILILCTLTGCTHDRRLAVRVGEHVSRPPRAAVLITVDGLDQTRLDDLLAAQLLPNIQREFINRGVRVRRAVTCVPSVTYACLPSILTGRFPGHHGVLGNKWFDRYSLIFRDYTTADTYRFVDDDFRCPTIYEHLADRLTVSIQCAVRRGATRIIDNWATSGINWFFGGYVEVDKLVAMRFELIADLANRTGRWPVFVHAYFPGLDEVGHRHGADSPQYDRALIDVDRQIGRIANALRDAGVYDSTYLVLMADHGHAPIPRGRVSPAIDWLKRRPGYRVCTQTPERESFEDRYDAASRCDIVLIQGAGRRLAVHVRGPHGWHTRPTQATLLELTGLPEDDDSSAGSGTPPETTSTPRGLQTNRQDASDNTLWQQPGVALVAIRLGDDHVLLVNDHGRAAAYRERAEPGDRYRLDVRAGDPLGYLADPETASFVEAGWHSSREWLAATADQPMPDLVPQIIEMFDSQRAGDIAVFADEAWGFTTQDRGGHGSVLARDMIVPLIFAGPDVSPTASIPYARTVDIVPTLLSLLGSEDQPTDGVSLAAELASTQTAALP